MTHKLIKTDNYLLVVDDSVNPYDSSKVGNPIAHLPLNGSPILEGVDLLPPYSRHQEDGLDKKSFEFVRYIGGTEAQRLAYKDGYIDAREKYKYTEDDLSKAIDMATTSKHDSTLIFFNAEEIIQSLHQYPTEFECEMKYFEVDMGLVEECIEHGEIPQKITTAKGIQWVGKYK